MDKKLQALYSLKFNPFLPDIPTEALWVTPALENFCWRIERQVSEGGFALALGNPGSGKSVGLRYVAGRLNAIRDVMVVILERPHATIADFYRELGDLFCVALTPHNRWSSAKVLREKWRKHIETSLCRPVLVVDEAQEACPPLLRELRLLASAELDSRSILTVILAGDGRLTEKLATPDLSPLASRVRSRLQCQELSPEQLRACLGHVIDAAGNPHLMSQGLLQALSEHAAGNLRLLMHMANELLMVGCLKQLDTLDEKLYLEVFNPHPKTPVKPRAGT